jgi:hypothetical protein
LGKHIPKGRKITQEEWKISSAEIFFKKFLDSKKFRLTAGECLEIRICEHAVKNFLHHNSTLEKIFFKKLLTIFAAVIWSSSRWHHCQAELISSEPLKTTVTRLKQVK